MGRSRLPKPDAPEPKGRHRPSAVRATLDDPPIHIRPTVPAISGCKAKEPFRSRPLRHMQGGTAAFQSQRIFCRKRQESGDKRLRFSPDAAVEKWPLRGSPATSRRCHEPTFPRQSLCSSPMAMGVCLTGSALGVAQLRAPGSCSAPVHFTDGSIDRASRQSIDRRREGSRQ